jgi:hypothetical protein
MKEANRDARRRALLREGFERVEVSFLKARARGAEDTVVLLHDPLDDCARTLVVPVEGAHKVAEYCEEARRRGTTTYVTEGMPKKVAVRLLAGVGLSEVAAAILAPAPAGGYWAIVVAAGGAGVFPMPALP